MTTRIFLALCSALLILAATPCQAAGKHTGKSKQAHALTLEEIHRLALAGNPRAQYALGIAFQEGTMGATKDAAEAIHWLQRSAESSYRPAIYQLAEIYEQGELVPRDDRASVDWYGRVAYVNFSIIAFERLGQAYTQGRGVQADLDAGYNYYLQAGGLNASILKNHRLMEAVICGHRCNLGKEFPVLLKKALYESRFRLGEAYELGRGAPQIHALAYALYTSALAAQDKNMTAAVNERLTRLRETMSPVEINEAKQLAVVLTKASNPSEVIGRYAMQRGSKQPKPTKPAACNSTFENYDPHGCGAYRVGPLKVLRPDREVCDYEEHSPSLGGKCVWIGKNGYIIKKTADYCADGPLSSHNGIVNNLAAQDMQQPVFGSGNFYDVRVNRCLYGAIARKNLDYCLQGKLGRGGFFNLETHHCSDGRILPGRKVEEPPSAAPPATPPGESRPAPATPQSLDRP